MRAFVAAILSVAALTALPQIADARDGCGRGWYFNGYACRPERPVYGPGYRPGYGPGYGPPPGAYYDRPLYGENSWGEREIWFRPHVNRRGQLECAQRGYTVQDGVCKRYRGY